MNPQLTHLGIYVRDLQRMVAFYSEVLRLQVTDRGHARRLPGAPEIVFMSATPTSHHQLVLLGWPEGAQVGDSGINQISFRVQSLAELRLMHRALVARNVASVTPVNHGNAFSLYSYDPEGNGLEVYLDLPWYVSQPHGDPLDLGLPDDELMARTESMVKADPSFMPREAWAAKLSADLQRPDTPEQPA